MVNECDIPMSCFLSLSLSLSLSFYTHSSSSERFSLSFAVWLISFVVVVFFFVFLLCFFSVIRLFFSFLFCFVGSRSALRSATCKMGRLPRAPPPFCIGFPHPPSASISLSLSLSRLRFEFDYTHTLYEYMHIRWLILRGSWVPPSLSSLTPPPSPIFLSLSLFYSLRQRFFLGLSGRRRTPVDPLWTPCGPLVDPLWTPCGPLVDPL